MKRSVSGRAQGRLSGIQGDASMGERKGKTDQVGRGTITLESVGRAKMQDGCQVTVRVQSTTREHVISPFVQKMLRTLAGTP